MIKATTTLRVALLAAVLPGLGGCASTGPSPRGDPLGAAFGQPMRDLSLIRDIVPPVLIAASADPYGLAQAEDCAAMAANLAALDAALGPDVDQPAALEKDGGALVASLVGGAIGLPYRGILRTISGAARRDKAMKAAILAGAVRRGFLKGRRIAVCGPAPQAPR